MNCEYCNAPRKSHAAGKCHKCGAPLRMVYGLLRGAPIYAETVDTARNDPAYVAFQDSAILKFMAGIK